MIIESHISNPKRKALEFTEEFLNLSWQDERDVEERVFVKFMLIVTEIAV
jgi:hypothetical protein